MAPTHPAVPQENDLAEHKEGSNHQPTCRPALAWRQIELVSINVGAP